MSGARGALRLGRWLGVVFFASAGGAATGTTAALNSLVNVKFFAPDMWNIGCCLLSVRLATSCEMKSPCAKFSNSQDKVSVSVAENTMMLALAASLTRRVL